MSFLHKVLIEARSVEKINKGLSKHAPGWSAQNLNKSGLSDFEAKLKGPQGKPGIIQVDLEEDDVIIKGPQPSPLLVQDIRDAFDDQKLQLAASAELKLKHEKGREAKDIIVKAYDEDGQVVAKAIFGMYPFKRYAGHPYCFSINVDEDRRRKGVATQMYLYAEKHYGKKLAPSVNQSEESKKLWANPNRKFGVKIESKAAPEFELKFVKGNQRVRAVGLSLGINNLSGDYAVFAVSPDGKFMGRLQILNRGKGIISPLDVEVKKQYQRMGIGTAMYRFAEEKLKKKLQRGVIQSPQAKKFWDQKNRPFGAD